MALPFQDLPDDSMAAEVGVLDLQENILRAMAVQSKTLKMEIRRVQKDMKRILSKLPDGGSEKSFPAIFDNEEDHFTCAGLSEDPDDAMMEEAAKPVSSGMATGGGPPTGPRASPASPRASAAGALAGSVARARSKAEDPCEAAAASRTALDPRIAADHHGAELAASSGMPRTLNLQADAPNLRRTISGELHMSGEPSSARSMQRSTAWTSRRFGVSVSSKPAARQPPQVVSDFAPDSVLPGITRDSRDFSRFSSFRASFDERHTWSRSGALRKMGKAEKSADLNGRKTYPISDVSTVALSLKGTQTMTTSHGSFLKPTVEELSSKAEMDTGAPPENELADSFSNTSVGASKRSLECGLARLCGLLPWSTRRTRSAWLYQQLFAVVAVTVATAFARWLKDEIVAGQVYMATTLEVLLAVGSALGLLSCKVHRSSESLAEAVALLRKWLSTYDLSPSSACILWRDVVLSLLLWLAAVGMHLGITVVDDPDEWLWPVVGFAVASLLQTALVSIIVYNCNCILAILHHFSDTVAASKDFRAATFRWHRVRATCQSVCRSIQVCFAIVVTSSALGVLAFVHGMSAGDASLSMVPGLLLHLVSLRTLVYAAMVSDCCERVPVLVNSVNMGRTLDPTRMYAVQYIRYCQTGFNVAGMRITCGSVLKAAYVFCAVAFAILTQGNHGSPFVH